MSQAGILKVTSGSLPPSVPTTFVSNAGDAIPAGNVLNVLGSGPITVSGSGNTLTITSTGTGTLSTLTGNLGGPISPTAGNINTIGAGSITIVGSGSTLTTQLTGLTNHAVQVGGASTTLTQVGPTATTGQVLQNNAGADPSYSTATYPSTTTLNQILYSSSANVVAGLSASNNGVLITSATGVPSILAAGTTGQVLTATTGSPPAWSSLVTGVSSVTGTANQILASPTTGAVVLSLIGPYTPATYTAHSVLVGEGTSSIIGVGPTATTGQVLQNNAGADPTYSTATYPSTTTINQILYSSSANAVSGLATANNSIITTGATGIPVFTALAANGQLLIGSGSGSPTAATLTAGTGITITNAANSITIASSVSAGIQTINGDTGSITGSTVTIFANNAALNAGQSVSFVNSGTVSTFNVTDSLHNTVIGMSAGKLSQTYQACTVVGYQAGSSMTSAQAGSTFFGFTAGKSVTTGLNTFIGNQSGQNVTTGTANTGLGNNALGGAGTLTGNYNTCIGHEAGSNYITSEDSNIAIFNVGVTAESNTIRIGNQGSTSGFQNKCFIAGITGVTNSNAALVTLNTSTGQVGQLATANSSIAATNASGTLAMRALSVVIQTLTAAGTYTPTAGMLYVVIEVVGNGGGGAGAASTSSVQLDSGGGGGGGEYARGVFSSATIGASQSITFGATGSGGSAGANAGTNGGAVAVGALISSNGGTGGAASASSGTSTASAGGAGGTGGTGGSFRRAGEAGLYGVTSIGGTFLFSGQGGSSFFGSGGQSNIVSAAGNAGLGYGAGGSGAANNASQSARAGGNGSTGIVVFTEYVIN
jgi:hypothetical protein